MNSSNTTQAKSIVKIKNLTRQFGEQTALDDVSIEVKAGQVFGIVGENGAGKTTLIKHMLGHVPVDYNRDLLSRKDICIVFLTRKNALQKVVSQLTPTIRYDNVLALRSYNHHSSLIYYLLFLNHPNVQRCLLL